MLFGITKGPCPRGNYHNFRFNLTVPYSTFGNSCNHPKITLSILSPEKLSIRKMLLTKGPCPRGNNSLNFKHLNPNVFLKCIRIPPTHKLNMLI